VAECDATTAARLNESKDALHASHATLALLLSVFLTCLFSFSQTNKQTHKRANTPMLDAARWLLEAQRGYFVTEEAMEAAGETLELPKWRVPLTRTLVVLGTADRNVPFYSVVGGVMRWAAETLVLGGRGHELSHAPPPDAARVISAAIRQFVANATLSALAASTRERGV
jgi:hypothetical protein